jgi:hypothetical protein
VWYLNPNGIRAKWTKGREILLVGYFEIIRDNCTRVDLLLRLYFSAWYLMLQLSCCLLFDKPAGRPLNCGYAHTVWEFLVGEVRNGGVVDFFGSFVSFLFIGQSVKMRK